MVNACADPDFFVRGGGGGGGGGGPSTTVRKKLCFYMFVLRFFSPTFSGDASNYLRGGGGVQMLISIEFDRTCD